MGDRQSERKNIARHVNWALRAPVYGMERKFVLATMAYYADDDGVTAPPLARVAELTLLPEADNPQAPGQSHRARVAGASATGIRR